MIDVFFVCYVFLIQQLGQMELGLYCFYYGI